MAENQCSIIPSAHRLRGWRRGGGLADRWPITRARPRNGWLRLRPSDHNRSPPLSAHPPRLAARRPPPAVQFPPSRGTEIPHRAAGPADHAGVQAGGHGAAGHDARAVPAVPAHPHLRTARAGDRLIFAFALGIPLAGGAAARVLLHYDAADLTLEGAFLVGLIGGPYAGSHRRCRRSAAGALRRRVHRPAVRGRLRLCGRRFARAVPEGGDLALLAVRLLEPATSSLAAVPAVRGGLAGHPAAGARGARAAAAGPRPSLRRAPPVLPGADERARPRPHRARHGAVGGDADQDLEQRAHRASPAGAGETAHGRAPVGAGQPDQPALPLQHAGLDRLARPFTAGHRPDGDPSSVGAAPPVDAKPGPFRGPARRAVVDRRIPRHRGHPVRTAAARAEGDRSRHARRARAEHDSAADHRKLHQARALPQGGRRADPDPDQAARRTGAASRSSTTVWG